MSKKHRRFHQGFNTASETRFYPALLFVILLLGGAFLGLSGCSSAPCRCGTSDSKLSDARPDDSSAGALVLMTDFGLGDGAVSAMKGVARETAPNVFVSDLTHEIPPYNIWEAAYRLSQTYKYWPKGTVFVSVIDPGVGSDRKSIAVKTKTGHIFVGPDNGLMTFIPDVAGIESIRQIDESKQRLKGSEESYTFHGRDLYVYAGARLAGSLVAFNDLGPELREVIRLPYQKPEFVAGSKTQKPQLKGTIPVLDPNYGNVWTNIPKSLFEASFKDSRTKRFRVKIPKAGFDRVIPLESTFAAVPKGKPLLYFNSLLNLALALNQGDFAKLHRIKSGADWTISVSPEE